MKHKFNLLIITPTYLPAYHIGGPIFQISKLSNHLFEKKIGHKILSTKNSFNKGGKKNNKAIYFKSYLGKLYFSLELIFFLLKEIKKYDKVYIISCFNFFSLFSAVICFIFNKQYFISPRGSLMKESINFKSRLIKKLWIFLFEKRILEKAKKVIFSSKFEQEETKKIIDIKNDTIISNFLTIKPYKNKNKILNSILFLGRITEKKNIDKIIYAFQEKFDFKIIIIGSGEKKYINFLKRIIYKKNLEKRIFLLPPTYEEKNKRLLFNKSRFSILLSKTENFGNTILESLLCRTPVIVSKNTGLSNFIKRNKIGIVCEDKVSSLSKIFSKINKGLNINISLKDHKKIINNFEDKKIMKKYFHLFEIK